MKNVLLKRVIFFTTMSIVLSSCVQQPVFKSEDYALIKSNYPIIRINGVDIENAYSLDLEAGDNSLTIVYNTYQHNYFCTFSWVAISGTAYEVTDQEGLYPLTLYHWSRKNKLWATRLNPVDPQECIKKSR